MPDVKSDLQKPGGTIVPDRTPAPEQITALERRMKARRERVKKIQDDANDPDLSVYVGDGAPDEVAFGQANKILLSSKGFRVSLDGDLSNPEPLKISKEESKIQPTTKQLDVGAGFNDVSYNNQVFNRRLSSAPPNIVNFYPVLLTQPPGIISGKNRQMMQEIIKVLQALGG
jgi:hypothetical protein